MSSCGIAGERLEREQDEEGDGEAEEAGRLGKGEAEEGERRHLRRRVARERADQRREDVADADAGADEGDAGKTGTDHLGGMEIHRELPRGWSVEMKRVAQIETGED